MSNTAFRHRKLGQLATFINGSAFRPSDWGNLGLPIIRIQNLNGSSDFNYYTGRRVKCVPVEPGDLLFSWSGSIGTSFGAHRWSGQAGVLNQHIFKVVPADGVNPGLLYHVLRFATSRLEQMAHGGAGLVHIKKSVLVDFEVKLPTNARHLTRVATLLDLAESAVSATDALIAAKREQKRGLMQQLLTGKVRFPGFTEPWKTVRLEQVASLRNAKAVAGADLHVRCVELEHIEQGTGEILGWAPAGSTVSLKTAFQPGDVLFGKLRPYLKKFALVDFAGFCSTEIWALVANQGEVTPRYLRLLVESTVIQRAANATSGTKMPRADWDVVAATSVQLPPIIEQHRITSLTWAIETELRLLRMQRVAMSTQRRGLMERLLSGDITIPSSDTSAA